jgi:hypothetical protein
VDHFVDKLGSWVIVILLIGSLVDIVQFIWIIKRTYRKAKRSIYNKIKKEILEDTNGHR